MEQYNVYGMSCAACSARVEKAVSAVDGVEKCSVNLLTNSMAVDGTASNEAVISAVRDAGYDARLRGEDVIRSDSPKELQDTQTPKLKSRLLWSLGFLAVLMYLSMGHTMLGFPLPRAIEGNYIALGLIQLLLTVPVLIINKSFFISGFKGVVHRSPNMDTLVALGSSAAFIYSTAVLFAMTFTAEPAKQYTLMHEMYFESSAMILALITLGKMLEARSKGKTTDALRQLMDLAPKTAVIEKGGAELEVPIEQVAVGDIFIVRAGQSVPVDGFIIDGSCSVDESGLTGESIPVDKAVGDKVSAATVNKSGFAKCRATRVGEDTTLAQIIKMVSDASADKAPVAKLADKVSGVFVPTVIAIAVITTVIWLLVGKEVGFSLARGISVLVISCPCALGLATPVAIMVGSGVGAKNGILFKTATSLEETGKVRTVVLDKTGTVTQGTPVVTDIIPADGIDENELLSVAYSLEKKSEHPLAQAVVDRAEELKIKQIESENFKTFSGNGIEATLDGVISVGGKADFIKNYTVISDKLSYTAVALAESGKTPLWFVKGGKLLGLIAVADVIKPDSPQAIAELKRLGIRVVMLTGDNEKTARAIGEQVNVDEVIADVLPDGKEAVVKKLQENGKVAMIGDGINDSPALTRADVGIAIGAGTDVAIDSADVVLIKSRLTDALSAIRLSRATFRNIKQNLFWAFFYNAVCIPVAAGVLIPIGIQLSPMLAAVAMSLSSFCVVSNALRLNLFNFKGEEPDKFKHKEEKKMEKTVNIEGMMCQHCEARVKQTLEALPQVNSAVVSHESGTAILALNAELSDSDIKSVIEAQGYKVI